MTGPALTLVAVCDWLQLEVQRRGLQTSAEQQGAPEWQDRYGSTPRKGADILVQCLEREGVPTVFAYPGGASMEIHQALTRSDNIRNILCRHEQVLFIPRSPVAVLCNAALTRMWLRRGIPRDACR